MSSASSGSQPGVAPIGPWRPRIALALAACAGLTGVVALLGWLKGSLAWAGAVASYVPMAPATALSTVALAGAVAARV
ncbi:MAG TPA: hypothetical protein VLW17_05460, partial [Thermoanaerobaculaceae bacterium]|nr:hypothetical protein [Thermoanaerobaculaceae bacterium]